MPQQDFGVARDYRAAMTRYYDRLWKDQTLIAALQIMRWQVMRDGADGLDHIDERGALNDLHQSAASVATEGLQPGILGCMNTTHRRQAVFRHATLALPHIRCKLWGYALPWAHDVAARMSLCARLRAVVGCSRPV